MMFKGLIIAMLAITLFSIVYLCKEYKRTGGYDENTDGFYGYTYPAAKGFDDIKDCNKANTQFPNDPPVSEEWMEGCQKYFKINQ